VSEITTVACAFDQVISLSRKGDDDYCCVGWFLSVEARKASGCEVRASVSNGPVKGIHDVILCHNHALGWKADCLT
jgi:hypothetical protein